MDFTKHLLHQIHDPHLTSDERALARCRLAKRYEDSGNYEAAREALGELWGKVGDQPKIEGLDPYTAAEVLLRVGTLTGWIGSTKQIEGAQETAKNLISQSIGILESLHEAKKVAEAQTEIGYCYWREGAFDEARIMLKQALSQLRDEDGDLKGVALLRSAAVEKVQNRLTEALHILTSAAPLFEASSTHSLKGRFHNEFATVLKNLGAIEKRADYIDKALIEYEAASYHFGEARHTRYQACVENNLAMLFLRANRLGDAHEHLVRAEVLFRRLRDDVHLAQVDETLARVLLAEGAVVKAEKCAKSAVQTLETGDEQSLFAEALTTYGVALSRLRREKEACAAFERAIMVGAQAGDLESAGTAAITLIEELNQYLSADELYGFLERAFELLKSTQNADLLRRQVECLWRALSFIQGGRPDWTTFSLPETLHRLEARFILMALEDTGGVVSRAADLLGLSHHQSLHDILRHRHKDLRHEIAKIKARQRDGAISENVTGAADRKSIESAPVRILHVEDDESVGGLAKEMLELQAWQVESCATGNAALARIAGDTPYDLLLIDYDLPGVNGLELVQRARNLAHRSRTPIVVLSGTPVGAAARQAGADAFLQKPEAVSSLVETIARLLEAEDREGREESC